MEKFKKYAWIIVLLILLTLWGLWYYFRFKIIHSYNSFSWTKAIYKGLFVIEFKDPAIYSEYMKPKNKYIMKKENAKEFCSALWMVLDPNSIVLWDNPQKKSFSYKKVMMDTWEEKTFSGYFMNGKRIISLTCINN